jgi:uncharacterized membrane-anchored protein
MKIKLLFAMALLASVPTTSIAAPAELPSAEAVAAMKQIEALPWITKPGSVAITTRAELLLDPKVRYLDAKGTNGYLKITGNLPEDDSYIIASRANGWFAVYSFSDIGYVKDDEKIDAEALLKTLKENQAEGNEERASQGMEPLTVVGWAVPPHYDRATNNLEYGIILSSPSGTNINYHMRILGRRGVMDAALVTSQEYLNADLAEFREVNKAFHFKSDESYAAFKDGDKVSEYGLAALVTGGAAAAALKGGLFKGLLILLAKFWKLIALGAVALFTAIRRFFGGGGQDVDDGSDGDAQ